MKQRRNSVRACLVFLGAAILAGSLHATAQTPKEATPLEQKLYQAAKKEGKLAYWDSLSMKEAAQFIKAFTDRYPGIEVPYWEGNAAQTDNKYLTEHQAGRTTVDVLQLAWYEKYKTDGLLTDLGDIVKDTGFPKEFCTRDLDAVSIEHTIKGTAYNTKLVSPKDVPRSWEDLLDPKWKGKIAIEANMETFIYLTKTWGEEKMVAYLKKMKAQNPIFTEGVTHTMTLLGAGEFPIGVGMSLHRTQLMQDGGAPVGFAPVSPAADEFVAYVAVRDAPHPNAAKLYLRWLMSPEGQSMVDKVRKKGNPLPGSGTVQSKAVEQLGLKIVLVPSWEVDFKRLGDLYKETVGFKKM